MPERLHIRLLGGFDLVLDGRRLSSLRSPRIQRFFAMILLRDGFQHRSWIAFELWPDSTEAQARTNLRKLLYELRQSLPDCGQFIEIGSEQLRWRETASAVVDVRQFREAISAANHERAAAVYAGDLLPACYDDWVLEARESLRTDARTNLAKLMEAAADGGDSEARLCHARRALDIEPTDETAVCHQMEACCALGDRNGALRAYHRYAEAMERELGVRPGEAVETLYYSVRNSYAPPEGRQGAATAPKRETAAASPFVGRNREMAALDTAWRSSSAGGSHLVLLTGEPGIGKSRLAQELGRRVKTAGHVVVGARAYEAAGRLPWGPVVDLLRSRELEDRIAELDPVWRTELARLLPELAEKRQGAPPTQSGDPTQRHRLFDAVTRALVVPDLPRLLIVDDLQWCDTETIDLIGFVIRSQPDAPVLIVGTVRPEEVPESHPLSRLAEALEHDRAVTTLRLEPLDMAATATLASQMQEVPSIDPEYAARLWTETAGNPLFVVETMRAGLPAEGAKALLTPTIRAVLRARLSQLSEDARHFAEMAAVIGRAFPLDLIADATGMEEPALIDAVDELWRRQIIREHGVRYDFSHDRLRDVALETISPARRRLLHRAAAGALDRSHTADSGAVSPQVAAHYDQAGMIEPAIDAYRTAGARAVAVSAFEEAVGHFQRALSLLADVPASPARDRIELEIRVALGAPLVAQEGYGAERAHQLYERALSLCRKLGVAIDPPILRGLGLARLQGCRFQECSEFGRALVESAGGDPVIMTEGRYLLGVSAFWQGDLATSREYLRDAIETYDPAQRSQHLVHYAQDPKAVCLVRLALAELWLGDPGRAEMHARAAHDHAAETGHLMTLGYVITYAAMQAAEAEDFERLGGLLSDAEELWEQFSMRYLSVLLDALRGWAELRSGSATGVEMIAKAVERSRAPGESLHLTYTLLLLARAHRGLGNFGPTLIAVREGQSLTARHGQHYLAAEFRRLEGELLLAGGDEAAARGALGDAAEIARRQGARWFELRACTNLMREFPDERTSERLKLLMNQIPSGHDLPAFRAAAEIVGHPG